MYKALIFDLDGTLLNTLDDLGNAMNRTLAKEGFPIHPIDAYRYFVGDGATMLITRTLPEQHRTPEMIQHCLTLFLADYKQHSNVETRAYEGIPEMLDAVSDRDVKMAVLSNKPDEDTKRCVKELLPQWTFDLVLGQREGVPRKPDPAGALEIARQFQCSPSEFLYVGDTSIDMRTASAARIFAVGVLWGFRTKEELQQNGARALLTHPMGIMPLLDGPK